MQESQRWNLLDSRFLENAGMTENGLKQRAAQLPSGVTPYWHQSGGSPIWESPVKYPALSKAAKQRAHISSPFTSPVGFVGVTNLPGFHRHRQ